MLNPIFKNDKIFLQNVLKFFIIKSKSILMISSLVLFMFILYFFLKSPTYISRVSFYTSYQDNIQSSLLSAVPGFMSQNFGSNNLDFSVANFISSEKFLKDIVNREYKIDNQKITLTEFWGSTYNNFFTLNPLSLASKLNRYFMYQDFLTEREMKSAYAALVLSNSLSYNEDRRTKLNHISLETKKDPELGKQIIENIYNSIVTYSNEIVNNKAREKKLFISQRLETIRTELKASENELLQFTENNIGISSSPSLTLKKNRIERDISLYKQLYFSLADQLELAKISEKDNTSSFFILDQPGVYSFQGGLSLVKGGLFIFLLSILFSFSYFLFKHREELFITEESKS